MSANSLKVVDGKQVEKILERGQKLRNSMLETILRNDPFTAEVMSQKHYNTPIDSSDNILESQNPNISKNTKANAEKQLLIEAYLKGEYLTKDQEQSALQTFKSMSGIELSQATEQTFSSQENTLRKPACLANKQRLNVVESHLTKCCFCPTCKAYIGANLDCDLRRPQSQDCIRRNFCSKDLKPHNWQNFQILKYADSLKISVHNICLNEIGNKKLLTALSKNGVNETYFIEYHLPSALLGNLSKNKSKVDSGLDNSSVRICSRRSGQLVNFNHTFTHDIANLQEQSLQNIEITFKISYRSQKQKFSQILGFAKLKFDSLAVSKNVTCSKALAIHFRHEDCPIVVGSLKVTAQLGCGRLYFGKDFVEAINSEQNSETLDLESSNSDIEKPNSTECVSAKNEGKIIKQRKNLSPKRSGNEEVGVKEVHSHLKRPVLSKYHNFRASAYFTSENKENSESQANQNSPNEETGKKQLLFGFIYISEAQFLHQCPSSYISCQPFCQNETSNSRLVANSSNPLYNFCQKVPLLYDRNLLLQLRENLTLVEFWERREQTDSLFGVTKLPLHQFYLAYRNDVILQHLTKNKLPIIGTDWWEPIYSIDNEELTGQVQVLTALGTEEQIENLESERGFKNDLVKAKYVKLPITKLRTENIVSNSWRDRVKVNKKSDFVSNTDSGRSFSSLHEIPLKLPKKKQQFSPPKSVNFNRPQKVDIGVQSDFNRSNMEGHKNDDIKQQSSQSQDMIASFLKILEQQRIPKTVVTENGTNTDNPPPTVVNNQSAALHNKDLANSNVRKTSDLLDTLQKALSIDSRPPNVAKINPNVFKARVSIKSANHLPSKKKIKAKKSKNKGRVQEEHILPSTYVTFETGSDDPVKITNVVPKSTCPQWNYECDVGLPTDLLTNGQKRLIFKVWKKSNNVVLQPNMQTDTVLGFAAVDLSVLVAGLPNVQGWFNIVDFSGACHGQINIHVAPLDNLNKFRKKSKPQPTSVDFSQPFEEEEGNDPLGRALKRKFSELDEITQRLRLRLSEVVEQESENENDEIANEFERDIDSLCIEEDFDMVNFEKDAETLTLNIAKSKHDTNDLLFIQTQPGPSKETSKEPSLLRLDHPQQESGSSTSLPTDRHLVEGKQRIDTLLEKLSLLSAENAQAFSSRYVSGCSVSDQNLDFDTEHILKDLDRDSRPNITSCSNLNKFKELYVDTLQSQSEINSDKSEVNVLGDSESGSSVVTSFSGCRPNPDGQGNVSDEKSSS